MFGPAVAALLISACFAALWAKWHFPGSAAAAVAWLLYAAYEYLMYARVLCSGECNIRVDLLLLWPALLAVSLMVPVRLLRRRTRRAPSR
jgi:hypothetical protein